MRFENMILTETMIPIKKQLKNCSSLLDRRTAEQPKTIRNRLVGVIFSEIRSGEPEIRVT